jgi:hypothetical protein
MPPRGPLAELGGRQTRAAVEGVGHQKSLAVVSGMALTPRNTRAARRRG